MTKQTLAGSLLITLLGLACASTMRAPPASRRCYSPEQIERIMARRDWGDGLADVAKEVGGSRMDVRAAERLELARRRDPHAAALTTGCLTTGQRSVVAVSR